MLVTAAHRIVNQAATSIAFGRFRLFPMQRLLTEAGTPVRLGSRAFDILLALLERAGELVTNDELMARVWPNTFVAPANVAVHISALRRALGDGRHGNRYVINVPGRGYRFVAAVTVENDPPAQPVAEPAYLFQSPDHSLRTVGRADTVHAIAEQLQQRRLLTVVGPDGVANDTNAFALLKRLMETRENSVWLVGLAPAADQ